MHRIGRLLGGVTRRIAWDRPARLLHDRRGATALEFALVAAPLIALLLATLETSLLYFAQQGIETATEVAARSIMTGATQKSGATQTQFQQSVCSALPPYMNCANLMIDVETYSSFSTVNTAIPTITFNKQGQVSNSFGYNTGGPSAIVTVRLMYLWPVPPGPLHFNLSNVSNGQYLLTALSVAKTEPYS